MDSINDNLNGKIFVLSAPSGAGKTTLVKTIKQNFRYLKESISCTTRAPRKGEVDGTDYFFLTKEEFNQRKNSGMFAEWAEVHGNFYGTPLKYLKEQIESRSYIICDIDYQGALKIRERFPEESVLIFVLPPSMEELESRLRKRATDNEDIVKKRLQNAREEVKYYKYYDYIVVNNCVEQAVELLSGIVRANVEGSIENNIETIRSFM